MQPSCACHCPASAHLSEARQRAVSSNGDHGALRLRCDVAALGVIWSRAICGASISDTSLDCARDRCKPAAPWERKLYASVRELVCCHQLQVLGSVPGAVSRTIAAANANANANVGRELSLAHCQRSAVRCGAVPWPCLSVSHFRLSLSLSLDGEGCFWHGGKGR